MKWYYVFIKSMREQIRDYWILVLTLAFAPFFVFVYFLMSQTGTTTFEIAFVNLDETSYLSGNPVNLGDSLIQFLQDYANLTKEVQLEYTKTESRASGIELLNHEGADVVVVLPADMTKKLLFPDPAFGMEAILELVGNITDMNYIIGAVWTEELVHQYLVAATGQNLPFRWKETTLGNSAKRSEFELYVPGLMIFAIIMMMFTASATFVREPESGTLERLKMSGLTTIEYLAGISMVQVIIGIISLLLTLLAAVGLGYEVIPGTFSFILLTGFLTCLSMISFSLIVAGICRSIKDVAIIGTFPLILLMFFSGAFFPLGGGRLFTIGNYSLFLNDFLSPTWAIDALNKVLIRGQSIVDTIPEMTAILFLTILYFFIGVKVFKSRHMKAI